MSTPLVLTLFTAVTIAAIAGIMGAAVWARARSRAEELEPAYEAASDSAGLFEDVHS